jgi:methylthioribose-1-phosphate isomerase
MKIKGRHYRSIWYNVEGANVEIIDQTLLPHMFKVQAIDTLEAMVKAIKTMQVRGAPLIGAAAAYGLVLAMQKQVDDKWLNHSAEVLLDSRPTAVNLRWAIERMLKHLSTALPSRRLAIALQEAANICDEDAALNQTIGQHGLQLIQAMHALHPQKTTNILTHCNAGWIATVDYGTALSPIYAAHDAGIPVHVWVDETRPRNQGASLTAWELGQHGVPHTVIVDSAGGHLMQHGEVDMVIVGADRVTRSGDVCNKIGTYLKALAAFDNRIPFYAAVPTPTIDWTITNGLKEIPIEARNPDEVAWVQGCLPDGQVARVNILPEGSAAFNPAFDVTPARLVTAIITEKGVFLPHALEANLYHDSVA